jgi:thioredoxin reductase
VDERYDVEVVGGGAAGLSGALALSRARRGVLVVDACRTSVQAQQPVAVSDFAESTARRQCQTLLPRP